MLLGLFDISGPMLVLSEDLLNVRVGQILNTQGCNKKMSVQNVCVKTFNMRSGKL
jgi:hypothetical protein